MTKKLEFVMVGNLIGYQIDKGEIEFISPIEALGFINVLSYALLKQKSGEE